MRNVSHQFKVNMPEDVKAWLADQARRNMRSQNSEVIIAIKEKMNRENEKASAQS